jgi:cytochrome c-type biogenesis protein CcmH/NrfF
VDPLWAVPVVLLVLGTAPIAYLLREVTGEVRSLRVELARAAGVRQAVAGLMDELQRRPAPGHREGRR